MPEATPAAPSPTPAAPAAPPVEAKPPEAVAPPAPEKPAETTPEAKAPEKKPEEKKPTSRDFAALVKRDKELRAQKDALKSEKAAIEQQRAAWEQQKAAMEAELAKTREQAQRLERLKAEAKANPFRILEETGLSYEELTQAVLAQEKGLTPEAVTKLADQRAEAKLEAFRKEQEEQRKAAEQKAAEEKTAREKAAQEQYQRAIEAHQKAAVDFIEQNAEKYELTKVYGRADLLTTVVEQHFRDTSKQLSMEEAAEAVEAYLVDEWRKAEKAKKFQAKAPAAPPSPVAGDKPVTQPAAPSSAQPQRTLTNDLRATLPASIASIKDPRDRAIAILEASRQKP